MQTINYEELNFIDAEPWKTGSFGKIRRCIFDNELYVYKSFYEPSDLIGRKRKLSKLSEVNVEGLLVPQFWVVKNKRKDCYLTKYEPKESIESICDSSQKLKYDTLLNAKKLILKMQEAKIIHSDLNPGNILYKNDDVSFIDFDNCSFNMFKTRKRDANDYCMDFIEKYGIKPELDIFMFNLITYYIMNSSGPDLFELDNESPYYSVRTNIKRKNYGLFDNSDGIKICKNMLLDNKVPSKDFLIDTIDVAKLIV